MSVMTATEWLASNDLKQLFKFLSGRNSGRKLNLYLVATCRLAWYLVKDQASRCAIQVFELDPDQELDIDTFQIAVDFAQAAIDAGLGLSHDIFLLRGILGNPFRSASVDPTWRTSTVLSAATAICDDRAFDRLPILADALEDAGCTNAVMLNHCLQPGTHVRGCWCGPRARKKVIRVLQCDAVPPRQPAQYRHAPWSSRYTWRQREDGRRKSTEAMPWSSRLTGRQ